jgi:hypothetical protein
MKQKGPWSSDQIQEIAIGIEPQTFVSWDYQERMGAAA